MVLDQGSVQHSTARQQNQDSNMVDPESYFPHLFSPQSCGGSLIKYLLKLLM